MIPSTRRCETCGGSFEVVESYGALEAEGELDVVVLACAGCGVTSETAVPVG